jgi:hypothetical protein
MATAFLSRLGVTSGAFAARAGGQSRPPGAEARMIKVVAPALHHPTNRTLAQFHNYWGESHGPLFANTKNLRRYVQHLTLAEAYGTDPTPTFDGVSMFWYDTWQPLRAPAGNDPELLALLKAVLGVSKLDGEGSGKQPASPAERETMALLKAVLKDDAQLFDRSTTWPMHHKGASVAAREHIIVNGPTNPQMVKAIFIASKLPGLTLGEFFDHWQNHHGPLGAKVPGVRRYVQNHASPRHTPTAARLTTDGRKSGSTMSRRCTKRSSRPSGARSAKTARRSSRRRWGLGWLASASRRISTGRTRTGALAP